MAHKHRSKISVLSLGLSDQDGISGDETPKIGHSYDSEHKRRVELLDLLKCAIRLGWLTETDN